MRKFALVISFFLSWVILNAQGDAIIGKYQKYYSELIAGDVSYIVHLPDGYKSSEKNYPVVYMLIGQALSSFFNAAATIDNLSSERIPDMILIGIIGAGTALDISSCPDDRGNSGPADSFCNFLRMDFIPETNRNFRTNGYRILFGHSKDGLFVLYTLMNQPDLFNSYVAASPMIGWCPLYYNDLMSFYLKHEPTHKEKLYVSHGDLDYVEVTRFIDDFKNALDQAPSKLQFKVDLIENSGHVPYISLNNALLYFFSECTFTEQRKKLSIPEIKSHFDKLSVEYGFKVIPKAGVLFDMAIDKKNEKEFGRATDLFKYLISLYPGNEIYHYFLGQTYMLQGDVSRARECFEEALRINPEFIQAKSAMVRM